MIWKTSTVFSFALCVVCLPRERRPLTAEQIIELHFPGQGEKVSSVSHQKPEHHEGYASSYPSYEFSYKVDDPKTHDKKAQHEERDGGDVTGNYWLIQPDGEKRYIKYHVDDESGFTAVINYTSPHARVYYNVMKHRENAATKVDQNRESGQKEEKDKNLQQSARQENVNKKKDDHEKEENERKSEENHKNNGEKPITKESIDKTISLEKKDKEDGSTKDQERDGKKEKHGIHDWDWVHEEEHKQGKDIYRKNEEGSERKSSKQKTNTQSVKQEKEQDADRDNREDAKGRSVQSTSRDSNRDIHRQRGHDNDRKKDHYEEADLWTGLKGWTIIEDHPQGHEKPVWEWDIHHDRSWSRTHTWNDEHEHKSRDKEQNNEDKKQNNTENKQKDEAVEPRRTSDKTRQDRQRGHEERKIGYIEKRGRDEEGKESIKPKSVKDEKNSKSGENKRDENKNKSRSDKRGDEESQQGGNKRTEGGQRRDDRENQRREQRGKHRNQGDRRGQSSYVHFTPIAYAQRY